MATSFLRQAMMFVLLPFLTRQVPPEQYSRVAVASAVAGAAVVVMGLGLETPVFRTSFHAVDVPDRRAAVLSTARTLLMGASLLIAACVAVITPLIDAPTAAWAPGLIVLAVVGSVGQAWVTSYALPLYRAQDRLREYFRLQLSITLVQAALLVVLVLVIPLGSLGWILAVVVAQWTGVALSAVTIRPTLCVSLDRQAARELLGFGLPLVPHALAHWSLAGVDRLVLLAFVPASAVGIYGMVYAVSAVVGTVLTEMNRALMNEYGRLLLPATAKDDVNDRLGALASVQMVAALTIGFGTASLGPPAFRHFFPPTYASGIEVIPWVILGYVLFGFYFVPVMRLTLLEGRSGGLAVATATGAAANVVANLLLIPKVGLIGAAQATAIGYGVMLVAVALYTHRVATTPIRVPLRPTVPFAFLTLIMWTVTRVSAHYGGLWHMGALAATALVIVVCGGYLVRRELRRLDRTRAREAGGGT